MSMRKRLTGLNGVERLARVDQEWLDLEQIATVEVSSEHSDYPIECALSFNERSGWRASRAGEQTIRLIFDTPTSLRHIQLRFDEAEAERTQEFRLSWSSAIGGVSHEIVRQQWNFSPNGAATEIEEYAVDLPDVFVLELTIQPNLNNQGAIASLSSWRLR